ncbi:MAG: nucleoside triphosphate hydrolase [Alphaproteobacteria bacterium]|nr:MAG: nucleoside triphosphate hydrolase [Alphaproteobacteria bacterium]
MREQTCQLLAAYTSSYPEELVYKEKMLQFLDTCPDCFLRSCRAGHFTASAFLLNPEKTHVLLLLHAKLDKWMQLGGHCDGDPDALGVAIKEAQEESGIQKIRAIRPTVFDIGIHLIPPYKEEEAHYHFDIRFLLHAYETDQVIQNHESKALQWLKITGENLPKNRASVDRMFEKIKKEQ